MRQRCRAGKLAYDASYLICAMASPRRMKLRKKKHCVIFSQKGHAQLVNGPRCDDLHWYPVASLRSVANIKSETSPAALIMRVPQSTCRWRVGVSELGAAGAMLMATALRPRNAPIARPTSSTWIIWALLILSSRVPDPEATRRH